MLESDFNATLKEELEHRFPGCMILKGNSARRQGIPDWLVLYEDKWAALESKRSPNAAKQNNQAYYVDRLNDMSFSAFVDPENYEEVLANLEKVFT